MPINSKLRNRLNKNVELKIMEGKKEDMEIFDDIDISDVEFYGFEADGKLIKSETIKEEGKLFGETENLQNINRDFNGFEVDDRLSESICTETFNKECNLFGDNENISYLEKNFCGFDSTCKPAVLISKQEKNLVRNDIKERDVPSEIQFSPCCGLIKKGYIILSQTAQNSFRFSWDNYVSQQTLNKKIEKNLSKLNNSHAELVNINIIAMTDVKVNETSDMVMKYHCYNCEHVFADDYKLLRHYIKSHSIKYKSINNTTFKCDICKNDFLDPQKMLQHVSLKHENYVIYNCTNCVTSFNTKKHLFHHNCLSFEDDFATKSYNGLKRKTCTVGLEQLSWELIDYKQSSDRLNVRMIDKKRTESCKPMHFVTGHSLFSAEPISSELGLASSQACFCQFCKMVLENEDKFKQHKCFQNMNYDILQQSNDNDLEEIASSKYNYLNLEKSEQLLKLKSNSTYGSNLNVFVCNDNLQKIPSNNLEFLKCPNVKNCDKMITKENNADAYVCKDYFQVNANFDFPAAKKFKRSEHNHFSLFKTFNAQNLLNDKLNTEDDCVTEVVEVSSHVDGETSFIKKSDDNIFQTSDVCDSSKVCSADVVEFSSNEPLQSFTSIKKIKINGKLRNDNGTMKQRFNPKIVSRLTRGNCYREKSTCKIIKALAAKNIDITNVPEMERKDSKWRMNYKKLGFGVPKLTKTASMYRRHRRYSFLDKLKKILPVIKQESRLNCFEAGYNTDKKKCYSTNLFKCYYCEFSCTRVNAFTWHTKLHFGLTNTANYESDTVCMTGHVELAEQMFKVSEDGIINSSSSLMNDSQEKHLLKQKGELRLDCTEEVAELELIRSGDKTQKYNWNTNLKTNFKKKLPMSKMGEGNYAFEALPCDSSSMQMCSEPILRHSNCISEESDSDCSDWEKYFCEDSEISARKVLAVRNRSKANDDHMESVEHFSAKPSKIYSSKILSSCGSFKVITKDNNVASLLPLCEKPYSKVDLCIKKGIAAIQNFTDYCKYSILSVDYEKLDFERSKAHSLMEKHVQRANIFNCNKRSEIEFCNGYDFSGVVSKMYSSKILLNYCSVVLALKSGRKHFTEIDAFVKKGIIAFQSLDDQSNLKALKIDYKKLYFEISKTRSFNESSTQCLNRYNKSKMRYLDDLWEVSTCSEMYPAANGYKCLYCSYICSRLSLITWHYKNHINKVTENSNKEINEKCNLFIRKQSGSSLSSEKLRSACSVVDGNEHGKENNYVKVCNSRSKQNHAGSLFDELSSYSSPLPFSCDTANTSFTSVNSDLESGSDSDCSDWEKYFDKNSDAEDSSIIPCKSFELNTITEGKTSKPNNNSLKENNGGLLNNYVESIKKGHKFATSIGCLKSSSLSPKMSSAKYNYSPKCKNPRAVESQQPKGKIGLRHKSSVNANLSKDKLKLPRLQSESVFENSLSPKMSSASSNSPKRKNPRALESQQPKGKVGLRHKSRNSAVALSVNANLSKDKLKLPLMQSESVFENSLSPKMSSAYSNSPKCKNPRALESQQPKSKVGLRRKSRNSDGALSVNANRSKDKLKLPLLQSESVFENSLPPKMSSAYSNSPKCKNPKALESQQPQGKVGLRHKSRNSAVALSVNANLSKDKLKLPLLQSESVFENSLSPKMSSASSNSPKCKNSRALESQQPNGKVGLRHKSRNSAVALSVNANLSKDKLKLPLLQSESVFENSLSPRMSSAYSNSPKCKNPRAPESQQPKSKVGLRRKSRNSAGALSVNANRSKDKLKRPLLQSESVFENSLPPKMSSAYSNSPKCKNPRALESQQPQGKVGLRHKSRNSAVALSVNANLSKDKLKLPLLQSESVFENSLSPKMSSYSNFPKCKNPRALESQHPKGKVGLQHKSRNKAVALSANANLSKDKLKQLLLQSEAVFENSLSTKMSSAYSNSPKCKSPRALESQQPKGKVGLRHKSRNSAVALSVNANRSKDKLKRPLLQSESVFENSLSPKMSSAYSNSPKCKNPWALESQQPRGKVGLRHKSCNSAVALSVNANRSKDKLKLPLLQSESVFENSLSPKMPSAYSNSPKCKNPRALESQLPKSMVGLRHKSRNSTVALSVNAKRSKDKLKLSLLLSESVNGKHVSDSDKNYLSQNVAMKSSFGLLNYNYKKSLNLAKEAGNQLLSILSGDGGRINKNNNVFNYLEDMKSHTDNLFSAPSPLSESTNRNVSFGLDILDKNKYHGKTIKRQLSKDNLSSKYCSASLKKSKLNPLSHEMKEKSLEEKKLLRPRFMKTRLCNARSVDEKIDITSNFTKANWSSPSITDSCLNSNNYLKFAEKNEKTTKSQIQNLCQNSVLIGCKRVDVGNTNSTIPIIFEDSIAKLKSKLKCKVKNVISSLPQLKNLPPNCSLLSVNTKKYFSDTITKIGEIKNSHFEEKSDKAEKQSDTKKRTLPICEFVPMENCSSNSLNIQAKSHTYYPDPLSEFKGIEKILTEGNLNGTSQDIVEVQGNLLDTVDCTTSRCEINLATKNSVIVPNISSSKMYKVELCEATRNEIIFPSFCEGSKISHPESNVLTDNLCHTEDNEEAKNLITTFSSRITPSNTSLDNSKFISQVQESENADCEVDAFDISYNIVQRQSLLSESDNTLLNTEKTSSPNSETSVPQISIPVGHSTTPSNVWPIIIGSAFMQAHKELSSSLITESKKQFKEHSLSSHLKIKTNKISGKIGSEKLVGIKKRKMKNRNRGNDSNSEIKQLNHLKPLRSNNGRSRLKKSNVKVKQNYCSILDSMEYEIQNFPVLRDCPAELSDPDSMKERKMSTSLKTDLCKSLIKLEDTVPRCIEPFGDDALSCNNDINLPGCEINIAEASRVKIIDISISEPVDNHEENKIINERSSQIDVTLDESNHFQIMKYSIEKLENLNISNKQTSLQDLPESFIPEEQGSAGDVNIEKISTVQAISSEENRLYSLEVKQGSVGDVNIEKLSTVQAINSEENMPTSVEVKTEVNFETLFEDAKSAANDRQYIINSKTIPTMAYSSIMCSNTASSYIQSELNGVVTLPMNDQNFGNWQNFPDTLDTSDKFGDLPNVTTFRTTANYLSFTDIEHNLESEVGNRLLESNNSLNTPIPCEGRQTEQLLSIARIRANTESPSDNLTRLLKIETKSPLVKNTNINSIETPIPHTHEMRDDDFHGDVDNTTLYTPLKIDSNSKSEENFEGGSPTYSNAADALIAVDYKGNNISLPILSNADNHVYAIKANMEDGTTRVLYIDPAHFNSNIEIQNLMIYIDSNGEEIVIIPKSDSKEEITFSSTSLQRVSV